MKPIVVITTGDPFGIGPEVSLKASSDPRLLAACRPLLIGDRSYLLRAALALPGGIGADPNGWPEVARSGFVEWGSKQGDATGIAGWDEGPAFLDMSDLPDAAPPVGSGPSPGPSAEGGHASVRYVKQAVGLLRSGAGAAMATAPISKTSLRMAGYPHPGHTELLADLCGVGRDEVVMMFVDGDLKVALLSIHLALRDAIAALDARLLLDRLDHLRSGYQRLFGADPRIAVCALNPHAGEAGMFGREEEEILVPAVGQARARGLRVSGPHPADTLFVRAARGEFDVVLALYHDQATIAVKSRAFGRAVNMTLGLPLIRTSVDHGTAWDIAGRGVADPGSLVEAVLLAARLASPGASRG